MLSVLIPVYNTNVHTLVQELLVQAKGVPAPVEIILADDASLPEFRIENARLNQGNELRYIQLETNIGRAAIRNRLAQEARYDWFLFLDCDSGISSHAFLSDYLAHTGSAGVLCGGRFYGRFSANKPDWHLHRKYGIQREQQAPEWRNKNLYQSFMTNNFLISKPVYRQVGGFDEQIREYGHEDTIFGYQLQKLNVPMLHLDNPVEHLHLQTNREFVQKSLQAAANLAAIDSRINEAGFRRSVSLLRFHQKMKTRKMDEPLFYLVWPFRGLFKWMLEKGFCSLLLLDILKYLYFIQAIKRTHTAS